MSLPEYLFMNVVCPECQSMIKPKWSKVAVALGGTAAMIPLAAIFGLKAGLLALFAASLKGNRQASELLRIKIRLMQQSERMGSFFVCSNCRRDASVHEVWQQLKH
jgi:ssDNA-binding Zn-finger/Zn-ribbon topoisomerase 1